MEVSPVNTRFLLACLAGSALGCSYESGNNDPLPVSTGNPIAKVRSEKRPLNSMAAEIVPEVELENSKELEDRYYDLETDLSITEEELKKARLLRLGMWLYGEDGLMIHLPPSYLPDTWQELVPFLEHHDPRIRADAAFWLGGVGEYGMPAVPYLKKSLDDDDAEVRKEALSSLDKIDPFWLQRRDEVPGKARGPRIWTQIRMPPSRSE